MKRHLKDKSPPRHQDAKNKRASKSNLTHHQRKLHGHHPRTNTWKSKRNYHHLSKNKSQSPNPGSNRNWIMLSSCRRHMKVKLIKKRIWTRLVTTIKPTIGVYCRTIPFIPLRKAILQKKKMRRCMKIQESWEGHRNSHTTQLCPVHSLMSRCLK